MNISQNLFLASCEKRNKKYESLPSEKLDKEFSKPTGKKKEVKGCNNKTAGT